MKTRMILAAMLLLAFGSARAQEKPIPVPNGDASKINTLVINGTGSVYVQQGDKLMLNDYNRNVRYRVEDSVLYLDGSGTPRGVTIPNLTYLKIMGTAGVRSKGKLKGENLSIYKTGTGELSLEVDYNNIYVRSTGTGNVILIGDCNVFCCEAKSIGKVNESHLNYKVLVEKSGDHWNKAFNINDELTDAKWAFLNKLVDNSIPFFEAESNRSWDLSGKGDNSANSSDMVQLKDLMYELGENLQQLSDSVDWEQFERDMEQWGESMEAWGRKMEKWGEQVEKKYGKDYEYHFEYNNSCPEPKKDEPKDEHPKKKSLLFDANWNGFEAGLNMLFDPHISNVTTVNGVGEMDLGIRPFRSWYFGFNIADVGIAFNRKHTVGLFTGVGIGWNNFSWKNPVVSVEDPETGMISNVPLYPDDQIKKSKLGLLYLQVPVMVEIRPTRKLYIDLGVTGGLRIAAWSKVKYMDNTKVTDYLNGNSINNFKLDASLRVGGNNLGFFANYALIPIYRGNAVEHTRPLSFGFSLNF